jgi:hypothetical protein
VIVVVTGEARHPFVEPHPSARLVDAAPLPLLRGQPIEQHDHLAPSPPEGREGLAPLLEGAREGAARFASGKGRGGNFGEI